MVGSYNIPKMNEKTIIVDKIDDYLKVLSMTT